MKYQMFMVFVRVEGGCYEMGCGEAALCDLCVSVRDK